MNSRFDYAYPRGFKNNGRGVTGSIIVVVVVVCIVLFTLVFVVKGVVSFQVGDRAFALRDVVLMDQPYDGREVCTIRRGESVRIESQTELSFGSTHHEMRHNIHSLEDASCTGWTSMNWFLFEKEW